MSLKEDRSPQVAFFESLIDCIEANVELGDEISLKELFQSGGIYAELGNGRTVTQYFDKRRTALCRSFFYAKMQTR